MTTDERSQALNILITMVAARAELDPEFRRAVTSLEQNLRYIVDALAKDPEVWRINRAFHVVHVPSLIAVVTMTDEMDAMTSVADAEKEQIYVALHRSASLAQMARHSIEQRVLSVGKAELDVLSRYAPEPAQPLGKPAVVSKAWASLSTVPQGVWGKAKAGAGHLSGAVQPLKDGLSGATTRAASVPLLAITLKDQLANTLSDRVASPITMRVSAGSRALESGLGAGVGLGVIVGVICPPLLPITAGGAVLAAMRTYRAQLDTNLELNAAQQAERVAELSAARSAALRQLTHGEPALQMETDDLSVTVNVDSGEADAIVLSGAYQGSAWSSLTAAQKASAVLHFAEGTSSLLKILAAAVSD